MKRLEGEVLALLAALDPGAGADRLGLSGAAVTPENFLGIEKNPRAVPVAELCLWLAWLQWFRRTYPAGEIPEPVLKDFRNIAGRDALVEADGMEWLTDEAGVPLTKQGPGRTVHPITGEDVPDPADRVPLERPLNPRRAPWPEAEFIVGNPPFLGGQALRADLGDGECEALWRVNPGVPRAADLAMHFWARAAEEVAAGRARRFGFITSNSITQVFSRRVVAEALSGELRKDRPLRLLMAVPNHPWVVGSGAAMVRIAMTVADAGEGAGRLLTVRAEEPGAEGVPNVVFDPPQAGRLNADLTIGVDLTTATPLHANSGICAMGVKLHGDGFIVSPAVARSLGLNRHPGLDKHIRPFMNGRDLTQRPRRVLAIDLFGLSEAEVRTRYPEAWQHVFDHVKPERDANSRAVYRNNWWIFGEPRREFRPALCGLRRYIATPQTAKHRTFSFLEPEVIAESKIIAFASDDAYILGVLSSKVHVSWMLATGGRLGVGDDPVYVKTLCFDPFPFPDPTDTQRAEIAALAEELDALRKTRIALHPHLTLTALYNVLDALRAGRALTAAERDVHEAGTVGLLRTLHDRLDTAVAAAYGWPAPGEAGEDTATILGRLLALNRARAEEEARGTVRWLRPAYQDTGRVQTRIAGLDRAAAAVTLRAWPATGSLSDQLATLRAALAAGPADPAALRRRIPGAPRGPKVAEYLDVLAGFGGVRKMEDGRYAA